MKLTASSTPISDSTIPWFRRLRVIQLPSYEILIKNLGKSAILNCQLIIFLCNCAALCSLLGFIETTDLTAALERFISTCKTNASSGRRSSRPQIVGEDGPYSYVVLPGQNRLVSACADVVSAIRRLMISYTNAFRVDFHLDPFISDKTYDSSSVLDCINFRVCALHRSDAKWNYDRYEIQAELYHGIMPIAHNQFIFANPDSGKSSLLFPNRILFDQSIVFYSVALCALPRESRLVLTLYGRKKVPESESGTEERIELGWTSHNFFRFGDPCWILIQGNDQQ